MEAEAVELGRIVVVGLILHNGLLRDAEPVVLGHQGAVRELEWIQYFTRHCHYENGTSGQIGTRDARFPTLVGGDGWGRLTNHGGVQPRGLFKEAVHER